jgi:cysteine desulfurase/selenocysteine lyase
MALGLDVRSDFPLLRESTGATPIAYFDNAATSLKPAVVIDAVTGYLRDYSANIHRGQHTLSQRASIEYESCRERVARFIGARTAEIVFVRGATEAANLVASSLRFAPGDNVVATVLEHHSNLLPWRTRAEVRLAPMTGSGLPDVEVAEALCDERTRLVTVTACSNVTGVQVPIRAWADMAHRRGVAIFVDAAQAIAHSAIDVLELDCDYLAFSGHKLLGPPGAGVLYGTREALERLESPLLGGGSVSRVEADLSYELRDLPWRLEAGTPDIAAVIGLGAAIDYLDRIGMEEIAAHERALDRFLAEHIDVLPELTTHGPSGGVARAPITSFSLRSSALSADYLSRVLSDSYGIMTRAGHHCAHPLHAALGVNGTLRVSLALYNTEEELMRLRDALVALLRRGERGRT